MLKISIIIVILILAINCKHSVEPPPNENKADTTSHEFTFIIDTLGKHPDSIWVDPSVLFDVFVVNENDVWVVGEISTINTGYDSSGNYTPPYSAAHWNGKKWEYLKFDCGYVLAPVNSIWIFSKENIWIAAGGILKKNGDKWDVKYWNNTDAGEFVIKLFALSENEIYGVGRRGIIVKYDGSRWIKMESGTDMDLLNVWGVRDEKNGISRVFAAGSRGDEYGVVLELVDGKWVTRFDKNHPIFGENNSNKRPKAVWGYGDSVYVNYTGYDTDKIYRHSLIDFSSEHSFIHIEKTGAVNSIHGNGPNDFFGVGHRDAVFHYNGKTTRNYFNMDDLSIYYSVKQYKDYVFICGINLYTKEAIVIRGKRNN